MFLVYEHQLYGHSYLSTRPYWATVLVLTVQWNGWIPVTQGVDLFIVPKCIFLGTCFSTQNKILLFFKTHHPALPFHCSSNNWQLPSRFTEGCSKAPYSVFLSATTLAVIKNAIPSTLYFFIIFSFIYLGCYGETFITYQIDLSSPSNFPAPLQIDRATWLLLGKGLHVEITHFASRPKNLRTRYNLLIPCLINLEALCWNASISK